MVLRLGLRLCYAATRGELTKSVGDPKSSSAYWRTQARYLVRDTPTMLKLLGFGTKYASKQSTEEFCVGQHKGDFAPPLA